MEDKELLRYARQIFMPEIDIEGQLNINRSHVAIVGLGGLGGIVSRIIAGAGVKNLTLIDFDIVDISNLPRQILFDESHIGQYKVDAVSVRLKQLDNELNITKLTLNINDVSEHQFDNVDVLVDCSDNYEARKIINNISLHKNIPYVYGAANRFEGAITVFNPKEASSPCLLCWQESQVHHNNCQQTGVLASIVNVIGAMQATECLKMVGKFGHSHYGKVNFYDGYYNEWQSIMIDKKSRCACQKNN